MGHGGVLQRRIIWGGASCRMMLAGRALGAPSPAAAAPHGCAHRPPLPSPPCPCPRPPPQGLLRFKPDLAAGAKDIPTLSSRVQQLMEGIRVQPGGLVEAEGLEEGQQQRDDGLGGSAGDR